MNEKEIVEFRTFRAKGLFVKVHYTILVEETFIQNKESLPVALMVAKKNSFPFPCFYPIILPDANYQILGLSHKLTEKQMIDELGLDYWGYIRFLSEKDIMVNYSDHSEYWLVLIEKTKLQF